MSITVNVNVYNALSDGHKHMRSFTIKIIDGMFGKTVRKIISDMVCEKDTDILVSFDPNSGWGDRMGIKNAYRFLSDGYTLVMEFSADHHIYREVVSHFVVNVNKLSKVVKKE